MATCKNVLRGADVDMATVKFKDNTGEFILIADIIDYQIYVYTLYGEKKNNLFTFMKTPIPDTDAKPIFVLDTTTVGFVVDRTQTLQAPCGILYVEIVAKFNASSEYISSLIKTGVNGYELCNIIDSANPQQML